MGATTNYGLKLTDDPTTYFKEWRETINGAANSNMEIIDTALASKAGKSRNVYVTAPADGWVGESAPYTLILDVEGLAADGNGNVALSPAATAEQDLCARQTLITVVGQTEGKLTIAANLTKPTFDLPIVVTLID